MTKATTVTILVAATAAAGALLGSGGAAPANPTAAGLGHTIRAFGYELSLGARLSRIPDALPSEATAASCSARVDTVFVLLLPTDTRTEGGS